LLKINRRAVSLDPSAAERRDYEELPTPRQVISKTFFVSPDPPHIRRNARHRRRGAHSIDIQKTVKHLLKKTTHPKTNSIEIRELNKASADAPTISPSQIDRSVI
jgi:hypothetical protein